jgi:hypothetical protein
MKQEKCLVQSDAQSLVWTQFQHLQEQMLSGKRENEIVCSHIDLNGNI